MTGHEKRNTLHCGLSINLFRPEAQPRSQVLSPNRSSFSYNLPPAPHTPAKKLNFFKTLQAMTTKRERTSTFTLPWQPSYNSPVFQNLQFFSEKLGLNYYITHNLVLF